MQEWLLQRIGCAREGCSDRLTPVSGGDHEDGQLVDGVLSCTRCSAEYPVLGGVPIVVPDPARWTATYRESILASLVEAKVCRPRSVEEIEALVEQVGAIEPMRFGDDWTAHEQQGRDWPTPCVAGDAGKKFEDFLQRAQKARPEDLILDALADQRPADIVEVGTGVGQLSAALASGTRRVIASDVSLRAVLRARAAASGHVGGVVLDAESLPLLPNSVDAVVALELIDLLDAPERFVHAASRALKPGGRLFLSTPNPEACRLDSVVEHSELVIKADLDGVPWIRAHSARHYQVYFTRVVILERAA